MFKNIYQNGLLSIFFSGGSSPLAIWDTQVHNGHIKRLTDKDVNSLVLEIVSTNVTTTYIKCPKNDQHLGIRLPFLVMIVKNLRRYFSFEITILDDKNMRRRFRISNFQTTTKIKPFCTTMPIGLSGGWNQIQFNLADFTRRAYGSQFVMTLRVQIHANVRLRRIYFADRLYTEEELPQDYKLFLPLEKKKKKAAPAPATPMKSGHAMKTMATPKASQAVFAPPGPEPVVAAAMEEPAPPAETPTTPVELVQEEKPGEAAEEAPEGEGEAPSEAPESEPAVEAEALPEEGPPPEEEGPAPDAEPEAAEPPAEEPAEPEPAPE